MLDLMISEVGVAIRGEKYFNSFSLRKSKKEMGGGFKVLCFKLIPGGGANDPEPETG